MDNTLGIICEIFVLIFNILIYMQVTVPKKEQCYHKTHYVHRKCSDSVGVFCVYIFFPLPRSVGVVCFRDTSFVYPFLYFVKV